MVDSSADASLGKSARRIRSGSGSVGIVPGGRTGRTLCLVTLSTSAPRLRTAALILLLDLLIVPLNPNGLRMFSYPIETLRSAAMQSYIAEWASPNFHHAEYWPFLLIVLGTFAALSWSRRQAAPARPASVGSQPVRWPLRHPYDAVVRSDRSAARLPTARGMGREPIAGIASAAGVSPHCSTERSCWRWPSLPASIPPR